MLSPRLSALRIPILLATVLAAPAAAQVNPLDTLALADHDVVALDVGSAADATALVVEVPHADTVQRLRLRPDSVRAAGYRLRVQGADGRVVTVTPPRTATFLGSLEGAPASVVAASVSAGRLTAAVIEADGSAWFVEPLTGADSTLHIVYDDEDIVQDAGFCGADRLPQPGGTTLGLGSEGAPACLRLAEIAIDVDFEYFVAQGSSVAAVVADVEAHLNAVNAFYARDVLVRHEISDIIVRTAEPDPYTTFVPGELLDAFRAEWMGAQASVPRDLAHLITGRDLTGNIIGLAWVGVICNQSLHYAWSQFTFSFGGEVGVMGHEMGHTWGAPHCLDSECNVMCGSCHNFGPVTTNLVLGVSQNAGCISDTGPWPTPLPPHALPEEFITEGSVVMDVLANDVDGNCDPLSISSFPAFTPGGGSLLLSQGTGAGGYDELVYTPADGFQGLDGFNYTVGDGTGLTDVQPVDVFVRDEVADLVLRYRLDELSGPNATDSSASGITGTYEGSPALGQPGAAPGTNTAVEFDGATQGVRVPNASTLQSLRSTLTVAVWVRPVTLQGVQRIFGNPVGWEFGLYQNGLRFTTRGIQDYQVPASLVPGAWAHVAVTFDEDSDVTFYVNGIGVGLVVGGAPANSSVGDWYVASHELANEFLHGSIDDLQVYDHVLTSSQVLQLVQDPGSIVIDCPAPSAYCSSEPNSAGSGATMSSAGTTFISNNDMVVIVNGCPPGVSGLYFYSETQEELPFGDGTLCLGGPFVRLGVEVTDAFGRAFHFLDVTSPPTPIGQITAGSEWFFSFWYRDVAGGPSGFNLANGLRTTWCP